MSQLRSATCHMGSHSVTCYPTQVNAPRLHPSQSGRYSIYLPRRDRRLSWPIGDLLHTEMVYPPAGGHTSKYCVMSVFSLNSYWIGLDWILSLDHNGWSWGPTYSRRRENTRKKAAVVTGPQQAPEVMNQLSPKSLAGDKRHTAKEPTELEAGSEVVVVTGQGNNHRHVSFWAIWYGYAWIKMPGSSSLAAPERRLTVTTWKCVTINYIHETDKKSVAVAQTFDEIDASVSTPDKCSIQIVRNPWKTVAYPLLSPGVSFSCGLCPV